MEFLYFAIFLFVILIPLILGNIIPIYKKHKSVTNGIINYDSQMKKFVYQVNLSSADIVNLLNVSDDTDDLSCTFDFENTVIVFSEYDSHRKYHYQIQEYDGYSILKLQQAELIGMKSLIPYKLNGFIVKKLNAAVIPFSEFGF